MPKRAYLILFVLGLAVGLAGAYLQTNPGYMDAYYYFYNGQQLANGAGFNEMLIWNYLDDPSGLPHPSHGYWMPATSLLAAAGIQMFSGIMSEFEAAQLIFILLVASIPPLTAALAYVLSGRVQFGWLAGFLAVFTGTHQPYWTTTDSFSLVMLLGAVFFLVYTLGEKGLKKKGLLLGAVAGLMHLTRAEGLLWLGLAGLGGLFDLQAIHEDGSPGKKFSRMFSREFLVLGLATVIGYLLVMAPWYLRNLDAFGSLLSPGGSRTLWVHDYNELFAYPASMLTPDHFFSAGWAEILTGRLDALWGNLKGTLLAMGMLFPGVLAIFGFWQWRTRQPVRLGLIGMLLLYLVLSLIFPFSAVRGSYLHSGAAFVPLILAGAVRGFDQFIRWVLSRFKSWEDGRIRPFLSGLLILLVMGYSGLGYAVLVIGFENSPGLLWDHTQEEYTRVNAFIDSVGAGEDDIVVCSNPPAFVSISGKPSIGMPDGGLDVVVAVVQDFGASWVLIEENHAAELSDFYTAPKDHGSLTYVTTLENVIVMRWDAD